MMTRRRFLLGGLAATTVGAQDPGFRLSTRTSQAVVGLADGWNSSAVSLQRYERGGGGPWRAVGDTMARASWHIGPRLGARAEPGAAGRPDQERG